MYCLRPSKNKNKKYDVVSQDNIVSFGDIRYEDFTKHKDVLRKRNYLARYHKEDWNDLSKAGTWSRYILWNKPTIEQSIDDMEKHFNIKIKYQP